MSHALWSKRQGESPLTPAKTDAQRQAERYAREIAAGRVQWKRWVHRDDVPALAECADKLARKRVRAEQKRANVRANLETTE